MESTRNLTSSDPAGSESGTVFDDKSIVPDIGRAAITKIVLGHADYVRSITTHYGDYGATRRGGTGLTESQVVLEPDTFITSVRGNWSGGAISDLSFESNTGQKWGPFGTFGRGTANAAFNWKSPSKDMGLLYFSGRADGTYVWKLQVTWAKYQPDYEPPSNVNYEEHISDDDSSTQASVILSKFARNLMSPVVTLVVGDEGVTFHACESILCNLPFFRSAFQGAFREATEKKIHMPEEDPEIVAALIEFLYNGNYTYAYDPRTTEPSNRTIGTTIPPVGNLREGEFHVRVYAIASKYSYDSLIKAAAQSFMYILLQLKDIDVVRHWKMAYAHGLSLSDWEDDPGLAGFKNGLGKQLKDLYVAHREEMDKTFAECPELGTDFLRVAVCSGMEVW